MLRIILLILLLYVFYRFIFRHIVKRSTDRYLKNEKQKFMKKNPHIHISTEEEDEEKEGFSLKRKTKRSTRTIEKTQRL